MLGAACRSGPARLGTGNPVPSIRCSAAIASVKSGFSEARRVEQFGTKGGIHGHRLLYGTRLASPVRNQIWLPSQYKSVLADRLDRTQLSASWQRQCVRSASAVLTSALA